MGMIISNNGAANGPGNPTHIRRKGRQAGKSGGKHGIRYVMSTAKLSPGGEKCLQSSHGRMVNATMRAPCRIRSIATVELMCTRSRLSGRRWIFTRELPVHNSTIPTGPSVLPIEGRSCDRFCRRNTYRFGPFAILLTRHK